MRDLTKLPVVSFAESLPSRLVNAKEMSDVLSEAGIPVPEARLLELADAYLVPHYRVDGGPPLFQQTECRKWIGKNLAQRVEGQDVPITYRIVSATLGVKERECPSPLLPMANRLVDVSMSQVCGVYFLCSGDEVVYVGQARNVGARVAAHVDDPNKQFQRAFAVAVTPENLDAVEGAFIRVLRPIYNCTGGNGYGNLTPEQAEAKTVDALDRVGYSSAEVRA
jgi:hypothetical protein